MPAAIIVSHGQPSDPDPAQADLERFTARVAEALPGWHVGAATLAAPGALDAALDAAGPAPLVYPLFMTEGWFTGDNLRKRLSGAPEAHVLRPLGVSTELPDLTADLLRDVLADRGWPAGETQLFIAGHGSGRSANSARDTRAFAEAVAQRMRFAEMRVGFVEEPPYLADQAAGLGARAICLPFFAAILGHVIDDIPEALDGAGFEGVRLDPIGCAPGVPALVARALQAEAAQTPRYRSVSAGESAAKAPDQTETPFSSTTARSAMRPSSAKDLSTTISAMPVSDLSRAIAAQISCRTTGASPSVASSRISRRGLVISARPMASICCSPPESEPADCARRSCSRGKSPATRVKSHSPGRAAAIRFSSTVRLVKQRRPSGTRPIPARAAR